MVDSRTGTGNVQDSSEHFVLPESKGLIKKKKKKKPYNNRGIPKGIGANWTKVENWNRINKVVLNYNPKYKKYSPESY